jgi:hypothetical protein
MPRVSRLMALAMRFDELIRSGIIVQRLFCAFLFSALKSRRTEQNCAENSVDQNTKTSRLRKLHDFDSSLFVGEL